MNTDKRLTGHAIGMIILLVIQYLLGMATSLFVVFPDTGHEGQLWAFAWKQIPLASHIIVGFLLLFGTIALLVRAIRLKIQSWILPATIGLIAVIGSIFFGSVFISSQKDMYSFIMATGFIIALLSYFWGLYATK